MVFGRSINGRVLRLGVSGLLRQSNLVMWDWETESWWQQGTAQAIAGEMTGTALKLFPSQVVSFRDFMAAYPEGKVLVEPNDFYDYNPYSRYDTARRPFLFQGTIDPRVPPMERVAGVQQGKEARAYPFAELAKERVVHDTVGGKNLVVFYEPTTLSALDATQISQSRAVGAASVFVPRARGQELIFEFRDDTFVDQQTGSTWNILGQAVSGPLKGERMAPLLHSQSLWFYWAAIHPDTTVYPGAR